MRSPCTTERHKTQRWFCLASDWFVYFTLRITKVDTLPLVQYIYIYRVDCFFDSNVAIAIHCFNLKGGCFFIFEAASNARRIKRPTFKAMVRVWDIHLFLRKITATQLLRQKTNVKSKSWNYSSNTTYQQNQKNPRITSSILQCYHTSLIPSFAEIGASASNRGGNQHMIPPAKKQWLQYPWSIHGIGI